MIRLLIYLVSFSFWLLAETPEDSVASLTQSPLFYLGEGDIHFLWEHFTPQIELPSLAEPEKPSDSGLDFYLPDFYLPYLFSNIHPLRWHFHSPETTEYVPNKEPSEEMLLVNIGRSQVPVAIKGDNLLLFSEDGTLIAQTSSFSLSASSKGIRFHGDVVGKQVRILDTGIIHLFGRSYLGELIVYWQGTGKEPELLFVHPTPIERYLVSTVASEVSPSWPLEALKAQAITARTYALWQKSRKPNGLFHLVSTVNDQVFKGLSAEHPRTEEAVNTTRGEILTFNDQPIEAYYHSTCGGHIESGKEGFRRELPYLPSKECPYCTSSNTFSWSFTLSLHELAKAFKPLLPGPITSIEILKKTSSERASLIQVKNPKKTITLSGEKFRSLLGGTRCRSTLITQIQFSGHHVKISGNGFGHGVGLCQFGAYGMAKTGKSVNEILDFYFPGTTLKKMY